MSLCTLDRSGKHVGDRSVEVIVNLHIKMNGARSFWVPTWQTNIMAVSQVFPLGYFPLIKKKTASHPRCNNLFKGMVHMITLLTSIAHWHWHWKLQKSFKHLKTTPFYSLLAHCTLKISVISPKNMPDGPKKDVQQSKKKGPDNPKKVSKSPSSHLSGLTSGISE